MAVDARIEFFACDLFNKLWVDYGLIKEPILRRIHTGSERLIESELSTDIVNAVKCRQIIFHSIYKSKFQNEYSEFSESTADFHAYLLSSFHHDLYKSRKLVMEKMLSSCAFVAEMCQFCYSKKNHFFIDKCYLVWAMYVDTRLIIDFYDNGGWRGLKRVSQAYISPYTFLNEFHSKMITAYGQNYVYFPIKKTISAIHMYNKFILAARSQPSSPWMVSTRWVDFCIENKRGRSAESEILSGESALNPLTLEGVEKTLETLKRLCDPLGSATLKFDEECKMADANRIINVSENRHTPKLCASDQSVSIFKKQTPENVVQQEIPPPIKRKKRGRTSINPNIKPISPISIEAFDRVSIERYFKGVWDKHACEENIQQEEFQSPLSTASFKLHKDSDTNSNFKSPNNDLPKTLDRAFSKLDLNTSPDGVNISPNHPRRSILRELRTISEGTENTPSNNNNNRVQSPTPNLSPLPTKQASQNTLNNTGVKKKKSKKSAKRAKESTNIEVSSENQTKTDEVRVPGGTIVDIFRLMLVLGNKTGVEYIKSTLHYEQEAKQ